MVENEREAREREGREEPELKVTDRRKFSEDGRLRDGVDLDEGDDDAAPRGASAVADAADRTPDSTAARPGREERYAGEEHGFERKPLDEPEGVDFTMLINGMAQPALLFLGEIPHPGTGQAQVDLEQARLQIDMLQLLRVKCRGNLTAEEEGLLDRILYQLRMLYVTRSEKGAR